MLRLGRRCPGQPCETPMSLAGRLEDVPVSDVMQFIHLGRRSGTLQVRTANRQARVLFHQGAIVGAKLDPGLRVGELLVRMGSLDAEVRDQALERQMTDPAGRLLGQILLDEGALTLPAVQAAVKAQVEETIYELVSWELGDFEFELDQLAPVDDIAFLPADLLPELDLNTQMVLLEAARVFDERHQEGVSAAPEQDPATARTTPGPQALPDPAEGEGPGPSTAALVERLGRQPSLAEASFSELHFVSAATALETELVTRLVSSQTPYRVLSPAGLDEAAGSRAIIAFELREPTTTFDQLAELCRARPTVPVLCIVEDVGLTTKAYAAGATAVVPSDPQAILGCFNSLSRFREPLPPSSPEQNQTAIERLHRIVSDLRSGLFSASVALSLMKVVSESVERAVLFLVQGNTLNALGAFGFDADGGSLADKTRGLRLALDPDDGLSRAIEEGRAMTTSWEEARLPPELVARIGPPRRKEVVLFPVLGVDRVILVVYTDNGLIDRRIEEVEILDLAAAEVGIAFENEILRRRLSEKK